MLIWTTLGREIDGRNPLHIPYDSLRIPPPNDRRRPGHDALKTTDDDEHRLKRAFFTQTSRVGLVHHVRHRLQTQRSPCYPSLAMSSFTSSSPSSPRYQAHTASAQVWRARSVSSDTRTNHQMCRGGRRCGDKARRLDQEGHEGRASSSKAQVGSTSHVGQAYREDHPPSPISLNRHGRHPSTPRSTSFSDKGSFSRSELGSDARNEAQAPPAVRTSGSPRAHPSVQAHHVHAPHAAAAERNPSVRRLTRLGRAQVPAALHITPAAPSPSSSPRPCPPAFPRTPTRRPPSARVDRNRLGFQLTHSPSVSSLSSAGIPVTGLGAAFEGSCTPSPSPRLQQARYYRLVAVSNYTTSGFSCIRGYELVPASITPTLSTARFLSRVQVG